MHGGMATYHGAPSGARDYVEADRSRADDYYLAEGTGIAQRFTADGDGLVRELASLDGDGYEAWVAGLDPDTGEPKGRLRADGRAVRFVEVTVNGPKSCPGRWPPNCTPISPPRTRRRRTAPPSR